MALSKDIKASIEAKLRLGTPPIEVAESLGVSRAVVYTISRKLKQSKPDELIEAAHTIPTPIIHEIVEQAKEKHTTPTSTISDMEAVAVGLEGLKKLDCTFQATMSNVLKRFDSFLEEESIPLSETIQISSAVASAYEKIFTKGTNIHIGDNNQHSTQQLTIFKNKQGV